MTWLKKRLNQLPDSIKFIIIQGSVFLPDRLIVTILHDFKFELIENSRVFELSDQFNPHELAMDVGDELIPDPVPGVGDQGGGLVYAGQGR